MSHFSAKSLTFYGVAITTVVILFKVVSAYGETNLKAPPSLDGLYPLETESLPACFKSQGLNLMIQQSGIYLRGQILPQSSEKSPETLAEETPFLNGKWNNQQIDLSGSLSQFPECKAEAVTLQASLQNKTLTGQLNLDNNQEVVKFTAQKQEVEKKETKGH
ncbi:hypothetical protein [Gloeothece verrucosa]|uniref:Uncharacterized protein n=1 Tax=Gloeothece verrucosa (strain PCC 7822) TaxID=497965 RepID=E0U8I9_GLOV7|nr:hypothetical protein [Gloeothece verrucosa]ADN13735.1 conserved hypothetical protein [Gloeothece verrucosa PCC 7822]